MTKRKSFPPRVRRRQVLGGLGGAAVAIGCSASDPPDIHDPNEGGHGGIGGAGGAGNTGVGGDGGTGTGGEGGSAPNECDEPSSLSAEELLAPIEHIVVLCMENRSFDHYLGGSLGLVEGRLDVDGLNGHETNLHPKLGPIGVHHMLNMTPVDPPHQWDEVHTQWNLGEMDGFIRAKLELGPVRDEYAEVMGYYVRDQIPIHHALADAYVLCNAYFCSVLGGTWPNRFYLHGATSEGVETNSPILNGFNSVWPALKNEGLTVKNYHGDVPWALGAYLKMDDLAPFAEFEADADADTLPNFSLIDPRFFGAGANDDHPHNANVPLAQALISDVYKTLAQSPAWDKCLLIVTYDEHGGFYDHVSPPISGDDRVAFNHMGVRVPALIAGPYVRQGCAVNTIVDHVAVLKTLSTRWGIAPLTPRMATSNDFSSFIDPARVQEANPSAPIVLPQLTINAAEIRAHARRIARGEVPAQHPELIDALRQHGILKTVRRKLDADATLKHHLERAARRGVLRVI